MGIGILIYGESGTGKSRSIKNLPKEKVGIINVASKPLPFKQKDDKFKIFNNSDIGKIIELLKVSKAEIIIIDDFQYIMAFEFMNKINEKGFEKFTTIANNIVKLFTTIRELPENKRVYILSHSEIDENGKERLKTIGKLLNEKINLEGLLTIVLKTSRTNGKYEFATQNNGFDTVKSPEEMFENERIENDLLLVDNAICDYYDINQTPQLQTQD